MSEIKFIEAANYTAGRPNGPPRGIVIHVAVTGEAVTSAEGIASFFHNQPRNAGSSSSVPNPVGIGGSSAHEAHDSDSTVQCVRESDTAWDAPPNTEWPHVGHEHAGQATQTRAQWLDPFGVAMLRRSAKRTAKQSAKYGIPVRRLTVAQIVAKEKGFAAHGDVCKAFAFCDHFGCPGEEFPWEWYLTRVRRARWLFVQYAVVNKAGAVLAKSATVRAGKKAAAKFVAGHAGAIAKALKDGTARITRKRQT